MRDVVRGAPVVLVTGDFVKTGGMDRANHALADFLLRCGVEVHLVAHRVDAELLNRPNAVFHKAPKPLNSYLLGEPLLRRAGRTWARRLQGRGVRVVVNGGNCDWGDVNWVHYVHAAWRPRASGGPVRRLKAAIAHNAALRAERTILSRARVVVANSQRTRADLLERLDLDPDRVHTVYYGVDPERFRPPSLEERAEARAAMGWNDDRPVVAFVGALGDLRKGLDTVLAAWRLSARAGAWDARLAVVGSGAALGAWREQSRDLSDSVEYLGFRSDVPRVLAASDVLVSPARYEAYGLNVHEALCRGLPALASRSSGVAERFPEDLDGLLIDDPESPSELASRLRNWRDGRASYAAAARRLSDHLRSWTWDDMAARLLEVVGAAPAGLRGSHAGSA
jgi:glycosyltransferase involved in cell wall biosynthesis